jgi:hypothetical protein
MSSARAPFFMQRAEPLVTNVSSFLYHHTSIWRSVLVRVPIKRTQLESRGSDVLSLPQEQNVFISFHKFSSHYPLRRFTDGNPPRSRSVRSRTKCSSTQDPWYYRSNASNRVSCFKYIPPVPAILTSFFLPSVGADIDLPMIAVIGSQSAGKSSLIESISGITLPRAAGTCTRYILPLRFSSPAPILILETGVPQNADFRIPINLGRARSF